MRNTKRTGWRFPMYRGATAFDESLLAAALPTYLAECLRAAGAWEVDVNGNHVTCAGSVIGPVFSFKWPVLAPFGRGELEVDPTARQVRYGLRVAHLIGFATVMTACMGAIMLAAPFSPVQMMVFLPVAWLWLAGGNLLIGVTRFNAFLRRSLAAMPRAL